MNNKIITTIAAIGITFTTFGITVSDLYQNIKSKSTKDREVFYSTISTDEWRNIFDEFITLTNAQAKSMFLQCGIGKVLSSCPSAKTLTEEYDAKLANAGYYYTVPMYYKYIPHLITNAESSQDEKISYIKPLVELAKKYPNSVERVVYDAQLPELVNACIRLMASKYDYSNVQERRKFFLNRASKEIKRAMREQGISFISPDGKTNPIQIELDALSNALNAPKFAGVKEWFAKWYPSYQWIDANFMSDAEIKKLCDDIYYGDIQFNTQNKSTLQVYLGVEGYNEFVKKYNGEGK